MVPHPGDTKRKLKVYHIHIDDEGDAIVSETVWMRLQQARQSGMSPHDFIVVGEVKDPPTLVVGQDVKEVTSRTFIQTPEGIYDSELQAIAQSFAPEGVRANITKE